MIRMDWSRSPDDYGFYRQEISFSLLSEPVVFASSISMLSAAIHPAVAETAKVQYTLSPLAMVEAGTARWIDWSLGDVSASDADSLLSCVTAIRGVSSGNAVLELVAI